MTGPLKRHDMVVLHDYDNGYAERVEFVAETEETARKALHARFPNQVVRVMTVVEWTSNLEHLAAAE